MTFKRVYEHITDKCPQLAARNTQIIHEWLASGYDAEQDIIPAIDFATRRVTKSINSFYYFSGFIRRQHETRLKQGKKPIEMTRAERDEARAKNIRWHKQRGLTTLSCGLQDYEWLDQYEKKREAQG